MATILKFTRVISSINTETLNLNDGVNYSLGEGWQPNVSRLKSSNLSGEIYDPVEENIPIRVSGNTASDFYDALFTLYDFLEHADNWRNGGFVNPVILHYRPINSILTNPVQVMVLGSVGNESPMSLTPEFNETVQAFEAVVTVSIMRKGQWLGDEETEDSGS